MSFFKTPEEITYWTPTANDGYGGKTWSTGVKVSARIANKNEQVMLPEGKITISSHAVYTRLFMPIGTAIYLGDDSGSSTPHVDAKMVILSAKTDSMSDMRRCLI